MKFLKTVFFVALVLTLTLNPVSNVFAVSADTLRLNPVSDPYPLRINLSGPRYGITFVPGSSELGEDLEDEDLDLAFSQFGWQFEYNATPTNGEVDFMVEIIGLLGGTEMGVILPSLTGLIGLRSQNGFEFGAGPNLSITGASLCVAMGKSFEYGGIRIPVNVSLVKGPKGSRISLLTGFALKVFDDD